MSAEGDTQGQQAGRELRGVSPVAGADVAHGSGRQAGRGRDVTDRRPPDAGRDDLPERVDPVKAAMQDPLGQRTAGPPAPPTAPPRDPHQAALRSLAEPSSVAAPPDQSAAARPAAPPPRPGHLLHARGMMARATSIYQPVSDVTATPSPFSAAITSRFIPIQSCRQQAYVRGLSDRDIESLAREAGLGQISKTAVSAVCRELRDRYRAFRAKSLAGVRLLSLMLDAIYLPVRPDGPREGVLVAWGFTTDGDRVLLDVCLGQRERVEDWLDLGRGLVKRGLRSPLLVVTDGAPGLIRAVGELWPDADRGRCSVHYADLPIMPIWGLEPAAA